MQDEYPAYLLLLELPECGRPESPVYSSVNPVGKSSVEYSCIQGYILMGNKRRNCTDYGWEGGVPMCQGTIHTICRL